MGINFSPNIKLWQADSVKTFDREKAPIKQNQPDVFVRQDSSAKYIEQVNNLFPYGELNDIYTKMCKELELDYPPILNFETSKAGAAGGGYSFSSNKITLNLPDILESDYKIIGIKNGKEELLVEPKTYTPLFINKSIAGLIVKNPMNAVIKGYDKLEARPVTDDEQRKLFILKLRHELIHAKQHMIMRQTEGIGSKAVIKAWRHFPKNEGAPKYIIDRIVNAQYQQSYWVDKPDIIKYSKHSTESEYAQKCLDAIQNYPPVASPMYNSNFIELEAYKESNDYIRKEYGDW